MKETDMRLISIKEARELLGGIGHWKIYQLINNGILKTVKIGKRRFFRIKTIYDYIMLQEQ